MTSNNNFICVIIKGYSNSIYEVMKKNSENIKLMQFYYKFIYQNKVNKYNKNWFPIFI